MLCALGVLQIQCGWSVGVQTGNSHSIDCNNVSVIQREKVVTRESSIVAVLIKKLHFELQDKFLGSYDTQDKRPRTDTF